MHPKRLPLVVVLALSIATAASALSPRDSEVDDASVWRRFWRNELDVDGVDVLASSGATTPPTTPKRPSALEPELPSRQPLSALGGEDDGVSREDPSNPRPPVWPEVFHALLHQTRNGTSSSVDLYYDFRRGRNANVIRRQLSEESETLYDVEYDNRTSFYFTRGSPSGPSASEKEGTCRTVAFPVGILPPNWLEGARYLGRSVECGFECHGWAKGQGRPSDLDFVHYYSRVTDGAPVRWRFHVGEPMEMKVMTYDVGGEMSEERWQAPRWCFEGSDSDGPVASSGTE